MILLTGAAGKTGRAVIRALTAKGQAVRAFVHREEHVLSVTQSGASEAVVGDMRDELALRNSMEGVAAVYHICPNVSPDETAIGNLIIAAARSEGVERFVYHSVLHPQTEAMPHHWNKLRVEEALFESGLPFTALQPAPYMQNILAGWESIVERGVYSTPYPVETRLSLVDLEDVAEAAAIVLTEPGHDGATYELVGTEAMGQIEVAGALSRGLGRPVRAEAQPVESWERRARAAGMGEYQIDTLIKMFRCYERFGLCGNPNILGYLLRRSPTNFEAFVERTVTERRGDGD
ncbi:MAG: NmrA family NAD(P)-binding protein [Chloroflexi bacterium]|nr:NmrA family NAD(P)-binding protein [Chloroflexota bacterium]MBI3764435.1 NmrA family NAD(P)-binding protein [Chloroflexota bacterium]